MVQQGEDGEGTSTDGGLQQSDENRTLRSTPAENVGGLPYFFLVVCEQMLKIEYHKR